MGKKIRRTDAKNLDWRPKQLGIGLHEMALAIPIKLTRTDFGLDLKKYLRERGFPLVLDRGLVDRLHRHAFYCRQQSVAVKKMQKVTEGKDWQRREAVFGYLNKKMDSFVRGLRKYRDARLPLTDMLVISVNRRFVSFTKTLKQDLKLYARMTANESELVSGYLKPEVESQYMLDIFNIISNRHRSLGVSELLTVVAGCIHAGGILPNAADEADLHAVISGRIRRARQAYKRESDRFEWVHTDDFPKLVLPPKGTH
jgi:hypothetical protein